MAEPGAGPMAATKEGSDSNSPAQPPRPPPPHTLLLLLPPLLLLLLLNYFFTAVLTFYCRPLSHLEMQENVGHVQ